MKHRMRLAVLAVLACVWSAGVASPAAAHPMGNFSINHYTAISVSARSVRVLYVVDMAEIPTFQELGELDASHSSQLPRPVRVAYLSRKARELSAGLSLSFAGRPLHLALRAADLLFPPGAGGLPTERIYLVLQAPLPATSGVVRFADHNFPGRAGWKEIVADGALLDSTVPRQSRSRALTVYPTGVTSSPPQQLTARLVLGSHRVAPARWAAPRRAILQAEEPLLGPGGGWSPLARQLTRSVPQKGAATWNASRSDVLSGLMERQQLPLTVLLLSFVVAFWFGAGHALSPGHGKTVVAAYLVGSRGTAPQAALLGLTVTATHTAGVFALGLITLYLSRYILPDQLYPWLGFVSGLLVAGMGMTLFIRRLRALRRASGHAGHVHSHQGHEHHHVHRHGRFGLPHSHHGGAIHEQRGVSLRSLLALGVSGGLLPCPSALVVLLSAIAFHRLAFGMLLIVAFSFGLATTLTGVGLMAVYGGRLLGRLQRPLGASVVPRALRVLPVVSALVVASLGSLIALGALGPGTLPPGLTGL